MEETHEYVVDCAHVPYGEDMVMVLPISINGHVHERIIRCRDCDYCHEVPGICASGDIRHQCWVRFHSKHFTDPDGFCSSAVPRAGGT